MKLYSQYIFPRLLDWVMSNSTFDQYRQQILSEVSGKVLEIGFGTGLNLSYYPSSLEKLVTVDPNPGMNSLAQKRIQNSSVEVENRVLSGEKLPMEANTFDAVVSTWTLCSIPNVEQALSEIHRVLKPQGKFYFIEHGLSHEPKIKKWQHRLTPIQKKIGDGCHLDRNIEQLVKEHFDSVEVNKFYDPNSPKIAGYMYQGIATKSNF
ncbi:MAG: class I SAM-dependent methyltransferase [Halothece sp.]